MSANAPEAQGTTGEHTPGWEVGCVAYVTTPLGYESTVLAAPATETHSTLYAAKVYGSTKVESRRRALLVAAAPDLLEALRQCYAHLGWSPHKVPAHVADDAVAAIAKAEGR